MSGPISFTISGRRPKTNCLAGCLDCKTAQRALRDRLMSRGKNCLPTVSRQFLTCNYPRPNCLLQCLPNCLSPTREDFLSSFKINPVVRVIAFAFAFGRPLIKAGVPVDGRGYGKPSANTVVVDRAFVRVTPGVGLSAVLLFLG